MIRDLSNVLFGLVLTAIGIAGGFLAARQGGGAGSPPAGTGAALPSPQPGHEGHDHEDADEHAGRAEHDGDEDPEGHEHAGHESAGGGAGAAGARSFTPQALRNLGVTVGTAEIRDFVAHRSIHAVVEDVPTNRRPVFAVLGGVVTSVTARPGTTVPSGAVLVTLARDAIARPKLDLTAGILAPVSEDLHQAVADLRSAAGQARVLAQELARVREFTETGTTEGLPVLPRKAEIDLRYEVERAGLALANARSELERHGLSAEEVARVEAGEATPASQRLWRRALERAGIWDASAEAVLESLPERDRTLPWSIAAIGELSAAGLVTDDLRRALAEVPQVRAHFVEAASLLLEGQTTPAVRLLAEQGALEPVIAVAAPAGPAPDWDVTEVLVHPGQRVAPGEELVALHDARTMRLRIEPVGSELGDVMRALEQAVPVRATPLLRESGPALEGLRVIRLATRDGERGSLAYAECANLPVAPPGDGPRSWRLRSGLRYVVHVPSTTLPRRFVLPAGAVAADGPDRVVFVAEGDTFERRPVHVEHEEGDVAVVADDGSLKAGERVATSGAFALSLALQAGTAPIDPHAGHGH